MKQLHQRQQTRFGGRVFQFFDFVDNDLREILRPIVDKLPYKVCPVLEMGVKAALRDAKIPANAIDGQLRATFFGNIVYRQGKPVGMA